PKTTKDDAFTVKLKNHFTAPQDDDDLFNVQTEGETSSGQDNLNEFRVSEPATQDSESEVEELSINNTSSDSIKGASTPLDDIIHV
ncbi:hypothetical protein Tco_1013321, partial [Tanacetum coccineum]